MTKRLRTTDLKLVFYVINLDVRQSRQASDSASMVKRTKERFRESKMPVTTNATIILL